MTCGSYMNDWRRRMFAVFDLNVSSKAVQLTRSPGST